MQLKHPRRKIGFDIGTVKNRIELGICKQYCQQKLLNSFGLPMLLCFDRISPPSKLNENKRREKEREKEPFNLKVTWERVCFDRMERIPDEDFINVSPGKINHNTKTVAVGRPKFLGTTDRDRVALPAEVEGLKFIIIDKMDWLEEFYPTEEDIVEALLDEDYKRFGR
eukprot:Pgem_evm1s4836